MCVGVNDDDSGTNEYTASVCFYYELEKKKILLLVVFLHQGKTVCIAAVGAQGAAQVGPGKNDRDC
jgi:hypothetical protein